MCGIVTKIEIMHMKNVLIAGLGAATAQYPFMGNWIPETVSKTFFEKYRETINNSDSSIIIFDGFFSPVGHTDGSDLFVTPSMKPYKELLLRNNISCSYCGSDNRHQFIDNTNYATECAMYLKKMTQFAQNNFVLLYSAGSKKSVNSEELIREFELELIEYRETSDIVVTPGLREESFQLQVIAERMHKELLVRIENLSELYDTVFVLTKSSTALVLKKQVHSLEVELYNATPIDEKHCDLLAYEALCMTRIPTFLFYRAREQKIHSQN